MLLMKCKKLILGLFANEKQGGIIMGDFIKQLTDALQAQLVVAAQAAYDQGFKDGVASVQGQPPAPDQVAIDAAVAKALADFKVQLKVSVDALAALVA